MRAILRASCAACAATAIAASAWAAPPAQPIVVQGLECRGDDPGWRLEASRTTAQFTATVPRKREVIFRGTLQPMSFLTPPTVVWRGESTHLPKETLVLTAREEACNAPAQGTHRAVLSIRTGEAVTACCIVRAGYDARVAPVANLGGKGSDDWSRALPDLLPAINACVAREGAKVGAVAAAAVAGPGTVRVRLVELGGPVDCTIDASGRGAPSIAPAGAAPPAGPLFYPPREPPPLVACGTLERVQVKNVLVGYLHYDPC
jgi:hypothetical protein